MLGKKQERLLVIGRYFFGRPLPPLSINIFFATLYRTVETDNLCFLSAHTQEKNGHNLFQHFDVFIYSRRVIKGCCLHFSVGKI